MAADAGVFMHVDGLGFTFGSRVFPSRYDNWRHYINVWQRQPNHPKAVDIVAIETIGRSKTVWLIEAKDYRIVTRPPQPTNLSELAQTVAAKAIDTISGLADAAVNAADLAERNHASAAAAAGATRIVLHLEPHTGAHTALFPLNFSAGVLQRLRQLVRGIDANPLVLNIGNCRASNVPWSVT